MTDFKRRKLLRGTLHGLCVGVTLGSSVTGLLTGCSGQQPRSREKAVSAAAIPGLDTNPFTLGVASGDPELDGFVIWTRLAPDPLNGGGLGNRLLPMQWQLASDPEMENVVAEGEVITSPEWAHSVHIELDGLLSGQTYWYRFSIGGFSSPLGRARTLPASTDNFRFTVAACQHMQRGYFTAYRYMVEDDPDLIIHVGDYIYESRETSESRIGRVVQHSEPITLTDYRNHYALYRSDPDLQLAHQRHCWMTVWDDHEVDNDYANLNSQDGWSREQFAQRRASAYRAYYEHMPLRQRSLPSSHNMMLYRSLTVADLIKFTMLDGRQYRDQQACVIPGKKPGRPLLPDCEERMLLDRSLLGTTQEAWVEHQLKQSECQWNGIVQQQLFAPFRQEVDGMEAWWSDDWNGYPAARRRMIETLIRTKPSNPVFLGGDIHSFWATNIPSDPDNLTSKPIASGFVTAGITSHGPNYDWFKSMIDRHNPHIQYFESRHRGYLLCDVNRDRWHTRVYSVNDLDTPASERKILADYVVPDGKPGPERA